MHFFVYVDNLDGAWDLFVCLFIYFLLIGL